MEFLKINNAANPYHAWSSPVKGLCYNEKSIFLIDKSLEHLQEFVSNKSPLKENSKVFFTKDSAFPVSMLSKLTKTFIKAKSEEYANYVITDDFKKPVFGILSKTEDYIYRTRFVCIENVEKCKNVIEAYENHYKKETIYYYCTFDNIEYIYQTCSKIDKAVQLETFCENIYSKKNKLSKEEFNNIYALLSSGQISNIKLAMSMFLHYKMEGEEKVFIIKGLKSYFNRTNSNISQFNKIERFFFYRLGYAPKEIHSSFYNISYALREYIQSNNISLSAEQKRELLNPEETIKKVNYKVQQYEDLCNMHISFPPRELHIQHIPNKSDRLEYIILQIMHDIEDTLSEWLDFFQVDIKIEFNEQK